MKTRKKPLSTSVDQEIFDRIATLAVVDNRSTAEIVAMCAKAGLPLVESEIRDHIKVAMEYTPAGKLLVRYGHLEPFCLADMVGVMAQPKAYPPHREELTVMEERSAKPKRAA